MSFCEHGGIILRFAHHERVTNPKGFSSQKSCIKKNLPSNMEDSLFICEHGGIILRFAHHEHVTTPKGFSSQNLVQ